MSWSSCMEKKIEHHYGPEVSACVKDLQKSELEKAAECIAGVAPDTTTIAVLKHLTEWSIECGL